MSSWGVGDLDEEGELVGRVLGVIDCEIEEGELVVAVRRSGGKAAVI